MKAEKNLVITSPSITKRRFFALTLALMMFLQMLPFQALSETVYSDGISLQGQMQELADSPPIYHTATFHDWDGQQLGATVTGILDGSTLESIAPAAPTRVGYTFVRWTPAEAFLVGDSARDFVFTAQYTSTNIYDLRIDYVFENGSQAALPYLGTYVYGDVYHVNSPTVIGYNPDFTNITGTAGNTQSGAVSLRYTVTYSASTGTPYKIEHYQQNIGNDLYTLVKTDTLTATTGAHITITSDTYTGFTAKTPTVDQVVAADGTTVVKLYYDRIAYLITYNTSGGTYIPPFQGRYGATIPSVAPPTRAGYTFNGWQENGQPVASLPTVLNASRTFEAVWTPSSNISYTLVYWIEDADPNPDGSYSYSYHSAATKRGTAGELVTLSGADRKSITYFTYDHFDENVPIAGDGSTKVNIYYTRNSYEVRFNLNKSGATLTINNNTYTSNQYSFTAKYNSNISALWPTADNIPNVNGERFVGWSGGSGTNVSKRVNFTSDLFNSNGSSRTYTAVWSWSTNKYELHYMIESLTGEGALYNGVRYEEDMSLNQSVNSGGNWSAKSLPGVITVGTQQDIFQGSDGDYDVYFYYNRNTYTLEYYNYNSLVTSLTKSYKFNETIPEAANHTPARPVGIGPNHVFAGWYTTADTLDGSKYSFPNVMPANDLRLYARWDPPTWHVNLSYINPLTGLRVQHDNLSVRDGGKVTRPADPVNIDG